MSQTPTPPPPFCCTYRAFSASTGLKWFIFLCCLDKVWHINNVCKELYGKQHGLMEQVAKNFLSGCCVFRAYSPIAWDKTSRKHMPLKLRSTFARADHFGSLSTEIPFVPRPDVKHTPIWIVFSEPGSLASCLFHMGQDWYGNQRASSKRFPPLLIRMN